MPSNYLRLVPCVLLGLLTTAAPLAAQQAAPRRNVPAGVQPRGAGAPGARPTPQPGASQNGAPQGGGQRYPVRQAQATAPAAGVPAAAPQPVAPVAPPMPFQLTPQQEALLDTILENWEKKSAKVSTFTCTFGRWEVNEVFGPAEHHYVLSEAHGEIKFASPDHGVYVIRDQTEWDKGKNGYAARTEGLDHWVCDGQAIYEFDQAKRQLIVRELDPSLRGKAITDGPLPFVFGTKKDQLKQRYWMRDITDPQMVNKEIWLEAHPRYQRDAANFQKAIIVLTNDFVPSALRIVLPDGKNKQDYKFENTSINNPLAKLTGAFLAPRPPLGWTKVVIPAGGAAPAAPEQAAQPAAVQR